jgi:5-dehydro-2-deoxygluconokinase
VVTDLNLSNANSDLDVVTIGRVSVDLYPLESGVPLSKVKTFAKSLGGSPTNVAVGAARLGRKSALVTTVGNDPLGQYVIDALNTFGVQTGWIGYDEEFFTPITFCERYPPDDFPIFFYRKALAPDININLSEHDIDEISKSTIFWFTLSGLSMDPSKMVHLRILKERNLIDKCNVIDLDYRELFWHDPKDAHKAATQVFPLVDIVVGNEKEVITATLCDDIDSAVNEIFKYDVKLLILKLGPRGVSAYMPGSLNRPISAKPINVEVVCGLGAGDAFGAALCHGLLSGWELDYVLLFANAAGAYITSKLGCADEMPDEKTVIELLNSNDYYHKG